LEGVGGRVMLRRLRRLAGTITIVFALGALVRAADDYTLGPDSQPTAGVAQGRVEGPLTWKSTILDGTTRDYWIYVPAGYDPARPPALMVFQDGHKYVDTQAEYRVPVVFDNLIAKREIPPIVGVFVNPGHRGTSPPPTPWHADNRMNEYDRLGDQYASFLIDELLPEIAKRFPFTTDPEGHAIAGVSSGGICAFTAAWERPDYFRKVVSHIGSFVDIMGGSAYPGLVRRSGKRPLRVFLQDGTNDLDNRWGNWPLANRQMAAALQFRGYDHRFELGDGGHTHKHGGALLPETLRWLWRDYPK
jgi:enterochelin esterase-like enzyme